MEHEKKASPLVKVILVGMAVVSCTNLFGLSLSSIAIFLGLVAFFLDKRLQNQPMQGSGLDLRAIRSDLRNRTIWIWFLLPTLVHAACVLLSLAYLPDYIEYETVRAGSFVPVELSVSSLLLFFVFALGEEIAWRAFFQQKLSKFLPITPVLILSSLLFTLGHYHPGNPAVVFFGLFFIFVNSMLYGVVFHKTKNAWISALSHYLANVFEVVLFVML